MSKHTKGPWMLPHFMDNTSCCECRAIVADQYLGSIAIVGLWNGKAIGAGGNGCPPREEAQANARLIAAAPELLEALKTARTLLKLKCRNDEIGLLQVEKIGKLIERVE